MREFLGALYDRFAPLLGVLAYALAAGHHGYTHGDCWCELGKVAGVALGVHGLHRRTRRVNDGGEWTQRPLSGAGGRPAPGDSSRPG